MRWLRKLLDAKAPLFEEGGKLEKFYPLYEAVSYTHLTLPTIYSV